MKNKIVVFVFGFVTFVGYSQIKVTNSGRVGIGTNTVPNVDKLIINSGTSRALLLQTFHESDYWQSSTVQVNRANTVSWVVNYNGSDRFFVHGTGYLYANGAYFGSDMRLKTDVQPIKSALEKVMALQGVSYLLKIEIEEQEKNSSGEGNNEKPNRHIGFIADEVQKVVPELVRIMPDGTKALAYQNMTALNLEAIKEQQGQIEMLNQEIFDLKRQLLELNILISDSNLVSSAGKSVLFQNKPNPFKEKTIIEFNIVEPDFNSAYIMIFDINGLLLKKYEINQIGQNQITVGNGDFKEGIYIYSLIINGQLIDTKRMVLSN